MGLAKYFDQEIYYFPVADLFVNREEEFLRILRETAEYKWFPQIAVDVNWNRWILFHRTNENLPPIERMNEPALFPFFVGVLFRNISVGFMIGLFIVHMDILPEQDIKETDKG